MSKKWGGMEGSGDNCEPHSRHVHVVEKLEPQTNAQIYGGKSHLEPITRAFDPPWLSGHLKMVQLRGAVQAQGNLSRCPKARICKTVHIGTKCRAQRLIVSTFSKDKWKKSPAIWCPFKKGGKKA